MNHGDELDKTPHEDKNWMAERIIMQNKAFIEGLTTRLSQKWLEIQLANRS